MKVKIALIITAILIAILAIGAVTTNTPAVKGWSVNATSADANCCEELVATPGEGYSLYLEYLQVNCASDITVTIGAEEDSNDVETVIIGPVTFKAAGGNFASWTFPRPLQIADNNSLTVDASGAGAVQVFALGHTK